MSRWSIGHGQVADSPAVFRFIFVMKQSITGQVPREWPGQEHAGRCLGERGFSNPNTKIQTQHKHVRKTNLCEKK